MMSTDRRDRGVPKSAPGVEARATPTAAPIGLAPVFGLKNDRPAGWVALCGAVGVRLPHLHLHLRHRHRTKSRQLRRKRPRRRPLRAPLPPRPPPPRRHHRPPRARERSSPRIRRPKGAKISSTSSPIPWVPRTEAAWSRAEEPRSRAQEDVRVWSLLRPHRSRRGRATATASFQQRRSVDPRACKATIPAEGSTRTKPRPTPGAPPSPSSCSRRGRSRARRSRARARPAKASALPRDAA